ncbi:hypothetical protein BDZ97DRAFT_1389765 [Flammula alnicola]|nr:hypothetical protein BDZ97DRAFT_1389765 [Flammula alnicola]
MSSSSTRTAGNPRSFNASGEVLMIMLLGETGVGKSTFISTAGPRGPEPATSPSIDPCTKTVEEYEVYNKDHHNKFPDTRVVLLDTPGFNDADYQGGDQEKLQKIIDWLKERSKDAHKPHAKLAGIIYLHDITRARFTMTDQSKLMNIKRLPRPPRLILVTTKWSEEPHQSSKERELQVALRGIQATRARFNKTPDSAWEIIGDIVSNPEFITLDGMKTHLEAIRPHITPVLESKKRGFFSRIFRFRRKVK